MPRARRLHGSYHPLTWDGDGTPCAHYVNGHVTPEEFRSAIETHFANSPGRPIVPPDAKIEHVYVQSTRVANDDYGNRQHEWRHTSKERGFPMTCWEIEPNRISGD